MTINYTFICANLTHDFYIAKLGDRRWFTYGVKCGVNPHNTDDRIMAGFTTKRAATSAAHAWTEWVGV